MHTTLSFHHFQLHENVGDISNISYIMNDVVDATNCNNKWKEIGSSATQIPLLATCMFSYCI
jgi:hypothetical protein